MKVKHDKILELMNFLSQNLVVSRGIPCAVGYPDIYARIESAYDWIKNITML